MFRSVCLASGAQVILKRYSKRKMDDKAVSKMRREVRRGPLEGLARPGGWGRCSPYAHLMQPCRSRSSPPQIRIMHRLRGQVGVTQILGEFENTK